MPRRSSRSSSRRQLRRTRTVRSRWTCEPSSRSSERRAATPISPIFAPALPIRIPFWDSVSAQISAFTVISPSSRGSTSSTETSTECGISWRVRLSTCSRISSASSSSLDWSLLSSGGYMYGPSGMSSASRSSSGSSPSPVRALIGKTASIPPSSAASASTGTSSLGPSRSALLTAQRTGTPVPAPSSARTMKRSPGPTPSSPLITRRTTSESASSRSTRPCIRLVRTSRGRCTPGRSTRISCSSFSVSVATPRIARRVVCGRLETIATWEPTRELTRVDLPTLGRPARPTKPERVIAAPPEPAPAAPASRPRRFRGRSRRDEARRGRRPRSRRSSARGRSRRHRAPAAPPPAPFRRSGRRGRRSACSCRGARGSAPGCARRPQSQFRGGPPRHRRPPARRRRRCGARRGRRPGRRSRTRRRPVFGASALLAAVLVVGGDDPLHQLVADHVLAAEADEGDVLDIAEDVADGNQAGALVGRQVDLGDVAGYDHSRVEAKPGKEHLHLLGARVLSLVEDHEGVVEGPAAHERQRRHLDHVALLVQRLRRHFRVAVAPDDIVEDLRRALIGLERAGHRFDRARGDVVTLLNQLDHLVDHGCRRGDVIGVALQSQHVAPQVQVGVEPPAQSAEHAVFGAGQLGGDVVVEGQLTTGHRTQAPSFSRTAALTRLPSARPPTFGITADITWPICRCSLAPVSATGILVGLRRLDPLLALALQHGDLVAIAQLRVLLEHVDDHPEGAGTLAVACFHRRLDVVLDLFENGHRLRVNGGVGSDGEALGDEVANVEADELPAVLPGRGHVSGVVGGESVLSGDVDRSRDKTRVNSNESLSAASLYELREPMSPLWLAHLHPHRISQLVEGQVQRGEGCVRVDQEIPAIPMEPISWLGQVSPDARIDQKAHLESRSSRISCATS